MGALVILVPNNIQTQPCVQTISRHSLVFKPYPDTALCSNHIQTQPCVQTNHFSCIYSTVLLIRISSWPTKQLALNENLS